MLERSGAFDHDPQRREARENEPVPAGPLGEPPEYLTETQKAIWHELAEQVPAGVLTIADRILVEITVKLIARLRDPNERLKAAETNQIIACLARMGLTPADRSKISAKPKHREQADDTFGRLASTGRSASDLEQ
jgi:phage terminase small subunit